MYFKVISKKRVWLDVAFVFFFFCVGGSGGEGETRLRETIARYFPDADVHREVLYLDDGEKAAIEAAAKTTLPASVIYRYVGYKDGEQVGIAYLDKHRVRTLPETLLVVVAADDRIEAIEVLSFNEPAEYQARPSWYHQFNGKKLSSSLQLKQQIDGITGATLTARAGVDAARRVLAIHINNPKKAPVAAP